MVINNILVHWKEAEGNSFNIKISKLFDNFLSVWTQKIIGVRSIEIARKSNTFHLHT